MADLKDGKGSLSAESGVLREAQYSFSTRFENGIGTNPEELIAAAHAGCFAMAFAAELSKAGITPESISATATVTLEKTDAGWTVTASHLDVTARIPGADRSKVLGVAKRGQAWLSDFAPAEGERHDGCQAGRLTRRLEAMHRHCGVDGFPAGSSRSSKLCAATRTDSPWSEPTSGPASQLY